MQLCNLQFCRSLPFLFLLFRCITSDLSGNSNDDDDAQSIASPLPDGSNSPTGASENTLKVGEGGQVWSNDGLFDTNAPTPLLVATEQTADACTLPSTKEGSQRRKVRRGDACTAPLQLLKPGTNMETKPRPGNNDGASETPLNRISPSSGPLFEWPSSWTWPSRKAPKVLPTTPEPCPNALLRYPICARRLVDDYQNSAEEIRDALPCVFQPLLIFTSLPPPLMEFKIHSLFFAQKRAGLARNT